MEHIQKGLKNRDETCILLSRRLVQSEFDKEKIFEIFKNLRKEEENSLDLIFEVLKQQRIKVDDMEAMEGSIVEKLDDPRRIKYMLLPFDCSIFLDYTNKIIVDERAYSGNSLESNDNFTTNQKFSIFLKKQPALCLQTRKIDLIDLS